MQNPFFYGEEVSGNYFTNRKKEIQDLTSDLSRGQNIIIYSPRRYGKTSLIKKVLAILASKEVLTFYVNLYAAASKRKFIEIYARAIARGTKGRIEQTIEYIKQFIPGLIPRIVIRPEGLPEFEFDYGRKTKNLTPLLEDLFETAAKYAHRKKKKAVVVFDEFQEILNLEDDEIERTLRGYVQSQKNVTYAFMGSKKHLMQKLFENPNRPFYKSGRSFPLNKISRDDFSGFIKNKFLPCNILVSDSTIKEILNITECHPYYTQMLCSILWDRNIGKKEINKKAIKDAVIEAINRESSAYGAIWDEIPRKRKLLLEALAYGGGERIYSEDFISDFGLGTPSAVQKGIKALQKKEIIEKENGSIIFSDIFFKQWILLNWYN